jgi:uncharacterized protein (TIGR02246 family)
MRWCDSFVRRFVELRWADESVATPATETVAGTRMREKRPQQSRPRDRAATEVRMVLIRTVVLCSLVAVVSSAAYAGTKGKDEGVREARAAIEAANTKFSEAFARGDANALAAMYTPDAIAFPPDSDMIRGDEAIGQFWKTTRDSGVQSATLTTIDVERSGDVAYEVGKVSLTIQPVGKEPTTAVAKYLVVWKRQPGGSWKLHRDIWNSVPGKQ